jgi:hypothetical protein
LQDIIDLETAMFRSLNIGEPMPEDRIKPFRMMRWMTYSVLADDTLKSWLADLRAARQTGRNVLTEKYARIDNLIPPIKNNPWIGEIVAAEVQWMEELHRRYPHMIRRQADDAALFEKYAACELETWSDASLELYHRMFAPHYANAGICRRNATITCTAYGPRLAGGAGSEGGELTDAEFPRVFRRLRGSGRSPVFLCAIIEFLTDMEETRARRLG